MQSLSREDTLQGLYYVQGEIQQIIEKQKQQINLVAKYQTAKKNITVGSVVKKISKGSLRRLLIYCVVVFGALDLLACNIAFGSQIGVPMAAAAVATPVLGVLLTMGYFQSNKRDFETRMQNKLLQLLGWFALFIGIGAMAILICLGGWVMILLGVLGLVGLVVLMKMQNNKIQKQNTAIAQRNNDISVRVNQLTVQIGNQVQNLWNNVSFWYPPDYLCMDAVNFFVHAFRNGRADSMKEAINLYEEAGHRQRMEMGQQQIVNGLGQLMAGLNQIAQGQQIMIQQLEYGNMLKIQQIHLQEETINAINTQTSTVSRGLEQLGDRVERSAQDVTRAINRRRRG